MKANEMDRRPRRFGAVAAPLLIFATTFGVVGTAAASSGDQLVSGDTSRAWPESAEEQEESHEWEVEFEMTAFSWEFFFGELAPPPDPGYTLVKPAPGGGRG